VSNIFYVLFEILKKIMNDIEGEDYRGCAEVILKERYKKKV
jgi:hypothetical protein